MTRLWLEHVSVHLPVLGARSHSLKHRLLASATGGRIGRGSGFTVIEALNDVSCDLREGDRLGVSGHNGAGKTTLLRVLSGAYSPTAGRRGAIGRVATLIDPTLGIEPEATGYENILLRGIILGIGRAQLRRMRDDIAEFSGLLMRLAFAITTSVPADILLMDEWLSVGDAEFRTQAEARMRTLVSGSGILVLATHSPELIRRECNRAISLQKGAVVSDGAVVPAQRTESK
jgi:lipopolysaccharide transport system ATP-binding protein